MLGNLLLGTRLRISIKREETLLFKDLRRSSKLAYLQFSNVILILTNSPPVTVGEYFAQAVQRNFG